MNGRFRDALSDRTGPWILVFPVLGTVFLLTALGRSITALSTSGGLLEAALNLLLLAVPGLVLLYAAFWLPNSDVDRAFYPRIAAWTVGGIVLMGVVLALRVAHPGVDVQFTFGTQAVLLSIGSIAGLGIGVNKAQALTHARALEAQYETQKRTEEKLEEAVEKLEASNERLEQFAYAASHDLQEPLRMVTSYLKLIDDRYGDELDDECTEFVEFAVDGAERMRGMIDGLLEYSRVDMQGESLRAVDLDAVLDDVLSDLKLRIEESGAEITREPLPTVCGDPRQMQQLFQNLLSNAIEYSGEEPPRIDVTATASDEKWTVSVRDHGIGIDGDDRDRIFEIFQRLHSVDDHAGSGIGLALCKRIVDRHDGEVRVESQPGSGSTFSVTLPAEGQSTDAPAGPEDRSTESTLNPDLLRSETVGAETAQDSRTD
ncbi:sensor histidine kinase [Halorientalis halophila]|uniref:sensor histidine kinase n=1 Tax=Halorientalis halophila TaxID=3108499 RepID=UPI003009A3B2